MIEEQALKRLKKEDIYQLKAEQYIHSHKTIIKELLENSLDGQSTEIKIYAENNQIKISDNGIGLDVDMLGFSKTSKYENENYKENENLGFRGTALFYISTLCDLTVTSKEKGNIAKTRKMPESSKASIRDEGTTIIVENIFKTCPIRKKPIKITEIVEMVKNYLLTYNFSVKIYHKNKLIYAGVPLKLKPVQIFENQNFSLKIFEKKASSSTSKNFAFFFKRPIKSEILRGVKETYELFFSGDYFFIINIFKGTITGPLKDELFIQFDLIKECKKMFDDKFRKVEDPPNLKSFFEVKPNDSNFNTSVSVISNSYSEFQNSQILFDSIEINNSGPKMDEKKNFNIENLKKVPKLEKKIEIKKIDNFKEISKLEEEYSEIDLKSKIFSDVDLSSNLGELLPEPEVSTSQIIPKHAFSCMKFIGQFNNGFLLCKYKNLLICIDQHAADEIYNYEKILDSFSRKKQTLLKPIDLEEHELIRLNDISIKEIEAFGFRIKDNKISQAPFFGDKIFGKKEFVEVLETGRCLKIHDAVASKACRTSVMIGDRLKVKRAIEIIENLSQLNKPWRCPHGRPVFVVLKEMKY